MPSIGKEGAGAHHTPGTGIQQLVVGGRQHKRNTLDPELINRLFVESTGLFTRCGASMMAPLALPLYRDRSRAVSRLRGND